MPTKRDVLSQLTRDELLEVVDRFELSPPDRRAKEGIVETIAASHKATLSGILAETPRARWKELCRAFGLDDSGKKKAGIVERLTGARSATAPTPTSEPVSASAPPASPRKAKAAEAKTNGGDLGFERTLFQAADKLRNNMDAVEYKHVALGLIFLKYISDV